jgi:hypothetical protein
MTREGFSGFDVGTILSSGIRVSLYLTISNSNPLYYASTKKCVSSVLPTLHRPETSCSLKKGARLETESDKLGLHTCMLTFVQD